MTCHEILVDGKAIRYVDSTPQAYVRLTSLFDTEPSVMPWLESFGSGETLVEIGAGIGIHAVYAAVFTGCRVFAFEPESLNYAELNKNIFVNHLYDRVSAFCMALTNEGKIGFIDLNTSRLFHGHEESTGGREQRLRQACVLSTLDTLVDTGTIQAPNHILIEVPGPHYEVLAGCRRTLENTALQSVLLEIDFQSIQSHFVLDMMAALGWRYSVDQLRVNPNFVLPPELIHTLRREKRDRLKYVFFRDDKYARLFRDYLADYEPPCPFPKKKVTALIRQGRTS